nr:hypothetical protein [Neobacillus sp. 179.-C4.2 HS]
MEVIAMAICDRGKIKWNPASFMPEAFAMHHLLFFFVTTSYF